MPEARMKVGIELGMGWLPDYPDFRDYTMDTDTLSTRVAGERATVKKMLGALKVTEPPKALPGDEDLRPYFPPIENQGSLGSCTANAGVGIIEYYERRAFDKHIDASRLFLYKVTRNLLGLNGDTGAFLRTTMGAMALFGVPPEAYWPYNVQDFDDEPSAFCYGFAQNYKAIQYFRLDPSGTDREVLLKRVKTFISAGLPPMFGFTVFSSIYDADDSSCIPYPAGDDAVVGGHAVIAVGFSDSKKIRIGGANGSTTGALLIRNSWGTSWGEGGYGWLPYAYVQQWLARDWWVLLKNAWVDTGKFGF